MAVPIWADESVLARLSTAIAAGGNPATINVDSTSGWPTPTGGQMAVGYVDQNDPAKIGRFTYTGKTATTLTGVTWPNGSKAHDVNAPVTHAVGAADMNRVALLNEPQTFTEDQTIEALNHLLLGSGGSMMDNNGTPAWGMNVKLSGGTWVRTQAVNHAAQIYLDNASGDLVFRTNSDAGTTVGSIITWAEKFRITKAGIVVAPGGARIDKASAGSVLDVGITGGSEYRFNLNTDGKLEWGSGTAARDTNLYRGAADQLKTDDVLHLNAPVIAGSHYPIMLLRGADRPFVVSNGGPEGVITGAPGSLAVNYNGGAGTTLYVKESGTGNTGWKAIGGSVIKSIQRGTIAVSSGNVSGTIAAVDLTKATVLHLGEQGVAGSTGGGSMGVRLSLSSSTTVTASKDTGNDAQTITIGYEVIEYV